MALGSHMCAARTEALVKVPFNIQVGSGFLRARHTSAAAKQDQRSGVSDGSEHCREQAKRLKRQL
jgi:hypothetical protein